MLVSTGSQFINNPTNLTLVGFGGCQLASFPGSPRARTASDGKLGGAWERGQMSAMINRLSYDLTMNTHTEGKGQISDSLEPWHSVLDLSRVFLQSCETKSGTESRGSRLDQ